jgi:hypothetical protein
MILCFTTRTLSILLLSSQVLLKPIGKAALLLQLRRSTKQTKKTRTKNQIQRVNKKKKRKKKKREKKQAKD